MVKWAKYILLLHLLATYATFRPLPSLSLRETHSTFGAQLRRVGVALSSGFAPLARRMRSHAARRCLFPKSSNSTKPAATGSRKRRRGLPNTG